MEETRHEAVMRAVLCYVADNSRKTGSAVDGIVQGLSTTSLK